MPGISLTIDRRVPVSRLKSVDLPTLGRPKITNDGSICVMVSSGGRTIENRNSAATFHCTASQLISLIPTLHRASPIFPNELRRHSVLGQKRNAPAQMAGAFRLIVLQRLEDDLRHQLCVAWFARSKTRRAVEIADGVGYETGAPTDRPSAGRQIDPVTDVIDLSAKLELDPFRDGEVFEDGKVKVLKARPIPLVARKIAHRRERVAPWVRRRGKRIAKDPRIDPLLSTVCCRERVAHAREGITKNPEAGAVGIPRNIERLASVENPQTAQLPAVEHLLGP